MLKNRAYFVINFILTFALLVLPTYASSGDRPVYLKLNAITVGMTKSSREPACCLRLMFQNSSATECFVPFYFSNPVWTSSPNQFLLNQMDSKKRAKNRTVCAVMSYEWIPVSAGTKVSADIPIFAEPLFIPTKETRFLTVSVKYPAKGDYILRLSFTNKNLAQETKYLADFNSHNPQFFETRLKAYVSIL